MQVTVLGAGVTGLTTAVRLQDAGCDVRVVTAAPLEESTSYLAAAVWFPTHVGPPERVAVWGARTLQVLSEQAAHGVPGVVMRQTLTLYRDPPGEPEWVASVGEVRTAHAEELPPGYAYGLRFVVPLVEMRLYLPWLLDRFRCGGGELEQRRVRDLAELTGPTVDAVINCSGLAARDVVGDTSVYPVRGQIIRVTNPGLTMSVRDELHPGGRAYVHPRSDDCILGGTLDVNSWDTRVDLIAAAAILHRCRDLVPRLAGVDVLEHLVGLRPGRPTVRLEEDDIDEVGTRIIHNYGHGGAGITLSWGCAEDVASLVARQVSSAR